MARSPHPVGGRVSLSRDTLVWDAPTAILDFETTGLSAVDGDRVVEVAIIRTQGLNDPDPEHFQDLVYPDMAMPAIAQNIHGIDDEMVMDAPLFPEVLPTIERMLNGAVFVAHNTRFDLDFLKRECWRMDREPPKVKYIIDTLPMARRHFGLPQCGLSALAKRMNIPLTNHHRAMADVEATLGIYREMLQAIDPKKEMTVGDMIDHIEDMGREGNARSGFSKKLHAAAKNGERVEIDYTRIAGPGSLTTRRQITVQAFRPPIVDAWCHLRDQARVFRLDRIQRVEVVPNR